LPGWRLLIYCAGLVMLGWATSVSAQTNVLITEFMASNTSTLADEDGDFEDWIEIYNAGTNTVNLNNWELKDSSTIWLFPQTNIGPGSFMIVFASAKNRRTPGQPLHTNFKLGRNGEYLALLYPDGVTVATAFDPAFPIQGADISYGLPVVQTPVTLVSTGAPGRFVVPPASSMDTLWTLPGYDDSAWMAVNNGVGFETDPAVAFAPVTLADSVAEFSGNQGSNNWFYGYWDKTSDSDGIYNPTSDFVAFPRGTGNALSSTNYFDGVKWDWPAGNPPWTEITSTGGHPSGSDGNPGQTNLWTIRRWVSETNGQVRITGTLGCSSSGGTCGDGTIGHILVDGVEVFQRSVFGISVGYSIVVNVSVGSLVDFVIDAGSANNDSCDTTTFTAVIRTAGDSAVVADSYKDWSANGVQGAGGWSYGYWIKTNASATYSSGQFVAFPSGGGPQSAFNFWDGAQWHWFDGDPPFDTLGQVISQPNLFPGTGTNALEHWVIRRWVSEISGQITIDWHFSKIDLTGEGTIAKVFRNGTQIDTISLAGSDFAGTNKTIAPFPVQVGDLIDFTVEPGPSTPSPNSIGDICSLNATISGSTTLSNQFATDVGFLMKNINASAYLRIPFVVTNTLGFDTLTLRLKYDDGIIVYLNGTPVASRNAPDVPVGDSTATASRLDAVSSQFEEISITRTRDLLVPGTNVLAIQGLNISASDGDFLAVAELRATVVTIDTAGRVYFTGPTPGALNGAGTTTLGPLVLDVTHSPNEPSDNQDLLVTARIVQTINPIGTVRLYYRVMFGSESNVVMLDDGLHGDGAAGDGIYGATISNTISSPGQMVRYYVTATDSQNNLMRQPPFPNPQFSAQYYGTVVQDPALTNPLPVLHLFITDVNLNAANNDSVGRYLCSISFLGDFYDNVGINRHGQSSAGFPKKSYDVDFDPDHHFLWSPDAKRVGDINLLTTYPDKAHMRNMLSYGTYKDAGSPYHFQVPIRVQTNGGFYGDWCIVENGGDDFLKRLGKDPNGALYKMYVTFTTPTDANLGVGVNAEKKTRKWEGNADLVALYNGVHLTGTNLLNYVYDNINVSEVVNTMAAREVTSDVDCCHKNYYFYRDSDGTGEWEMFPWDVDLAFGRNWSSSQTYWDDAVYPQNGLFVGNNNSFLQAIFLSGTASRQMYLRRCRTLMDELQQTNGTPADQLHYEKQIDQLVPFLAPDAALDLVKWGTWGGGATGIFATNSPYWRSLPQSVAELKTNYMVARRNFVFGSKMSDPSEFPDAQPTNVVILFGSLDYNPASGDQAQEYLQLINTNRFAVDLSGWTLSGAVDLTFQSGSVISTTNTMYVVADKKAFRSRTTGPHGGMGLYIEGPYKGQLSARGESIILTDKYGHSRTNTYIGSPSPAQLYLRVTEIMYHPPRDPGAASGTEEQYEYLELKNISPSVTLNLNGVHFTNGIQFAFTGSAVTNLAPGQTVLIVKSIAAFTARYGGGFNIAGQYVGALDNGGENLRIDDAVGERVLDFSYNNSWYPITDGAGPSLVIVDENAPWNTWDNKSSWRPSTHEKGSPGLTDPPPVAVLTPILINEILTHTDPPLTDAIELYNTNNAAVNIGGWFLTDDFDKPKQFRIPNGTSIAANGYLVFYASNSFGATFNLSSHGEEVYLFSGDANTNLTGYFHGFDFGAQANGVTFGRYINSVGDEHFPAQVTPSLGSANIGPKVGPIVLSAINYHPPDLLTVWGLLNNEMDEFIELENITGVDQPLFDPNFPTNAWLVRGGINYTFPTNVTLPPGGHAVVVSFDPSDAAAAGRFRDTNNVAQATPLFGPFDGHLDNSSDSIELARPDVPDPANAIEPNAVYYILVDKVSYSADPPWATLVPGAFLHRFSRTGYGNDPTNWVVPVAIIGQPQSQTVRLPDGVNPTTSVTFSVGFAGSYPIGFQWLYNGTPIPGANSQALTLSTAGLGQAGDYSVVVTNSYSSATSRVARLSFYSNFGWRFATLTGNYGNLSNSVATNLLIFMTAAGEAYVDDISLVPLSGPYAGINLITNGDFESDLSGPWIVPASLSSSVITNTYAHSGNSSLHVVSTSAGSIANAIKQVVPPMTTNIFCTLSYWYHTLPGGGVLNVRTFPGSGLQLGTNILSTDTAPGIASQPNPSAVPPGGQASFSVGAFGSEPFTYQWFKDGSLLANGGKISGADTATLTVSGAVDLDVGNYSSRVSNVFGGTNSSSAALSLLPSPPIVSVQPQSQHGVCRGSVTFTVVAIGTAPFTYQWHSNTTDILNATNASLTLSNLSPSANGQYSVGVTNSLGGTNSIAALLVVDDLQPSLVAHRDGTNLVVTWTRPCTPHQLEQADSLGSNSWLSSGAPVQDSATSSTATIPIGNASRFYRLRKQ
jgi:hypothetical protein